MSVAGKSKKSEMVEEPRELLQEEILTWRKVRALAESEIGKKPEILLNVEEKIEINDGIPAISVI